MIKVSIVVVAGLACVEAVHAQVQVSPSVVACGASTVSSSGVNLSATIGQSSAGEAASYPVVTRAGYWNAFALCQADSNGDGSVSIDDLFFYLSLWFTGDPRADVDTQSGVSIDDLFVYLNAWFIGC